ncbi:hypothetical protein Pmani_036065 [Petrolisthes manimaculis]|uniref:NIPSNAP domain-containing protein n=1 Tax=Petrolisthes manimaculis TaxID=1843537 RepID=A0AAE1NJ94_9EUCA|nr:hypothetical protein Pmani_036065 [Petrolisthes manimaculis]
MGVLRVVLLEGGRRRSVVGRGVMRRSTWIASPANNYRRNISTNHSPSQQSANSASVHQKQPVYELRTYTVYPDKVRDYLKLTADLFHLRTAHSKPLGFWTTEIGGLNQVVHIWEYESLKHRAGVRARLAGDTEWLGQYVSKAVTMWQQQDNSLLTLLPGTQLNLPKSTGVYELQTLHMHGGPGVWSRALLEYVRGCEGACGGSSVSVGAWGSVLGPLNMVALLWQHKDQDGYLALSEASHTLKEGTALVPHITSGHSKLLLPHAVSPLQ